MYNDSYLKKIIEKYDDENVSDEQILELICELANSGKKIQFAHQVFDFASTGGPSSLTTLLVPLYLYGMGGGVINLAVMGRPAGAVDVLSQIEGYNLESIHNNFKMEPPFYIHLVANQSFAPLDKALFEYRKKIGKVNVPNLAIASLLSKKVASGAKHIGLDVRVSKFGNFGEDWAANVRNARKFNVLAEQLGIQSTCFLSDANNPYQKYIGRGEALEALYDIFENEMDNQLGEHLQYCEMVAKRIIDKAGIAHSRKRVDLKKCFEDNLQLQGSNYDCFISAVKTVKEQSHTIVYAGKRGYLRYNLEKIRSYIVRRQNMEQSNAKYPDPVGVVLLCKAGDFVENGTPIFSVRNLAPEDREKLSELYDIQKEKIVIVRKNEVI